MLVGGSLVGWVTFNLVEGVLDIHHIRSGPDELWWDLEFLAWGAVMLVLGAPADAGRGPEDVPGRDALTVVV